MIFVTVGTDEFPFDRLIREVDALQARGALGEDVFIQTGSARRPPEHCRFAAFLPYQEMEARMGSARIVITHGGPGSIMPAIHAGKIPLVVPRRKRFGEVVDDHQVLFARRLAAEGRIILVEDVEGLGAAIATFESRAGELKSRANRDRIQPESNVSRFARALDEICRTLLRKGRKRRPDLRSGDERP